MAEVHQANLSRKRTEAKRWQKAEKVVEQIIAKFMPTNVANDIRLDIFSYLRDLIRRNLNFNVQSYGSVPLKTYLPGADIDLTVCGVNDDRVILQIASLLESERKNASQKFVIKDIQLINSQVKIVKCIVQDIVVDISINQIGGVSALCFLEHVDRLIGKNHLFKRSIILIKTWCYYESRIIGAHVGLLSSYGLEIMVLCIFNVFHKSLYGPLSVLYKFLEYFGTFDWDNYFISLTGPVRISSLSEIITEKPPNSNDLLLTSVFLGYCFRAYSVPTRSRNVVPIKHLNIIDPLKYDNNVGRSVSKANSFRIRSAFHFGARNLGRILMAREDNIVDGLHKFFKYSTNLHTVGTTLDSLRLKPLDLTGDMNTNLASLNEARRWYMLTLATLSPPLPLPLPLPPPPPPPSHRHFPVLAAAQRMPPLMPLIPFTKPFLHRNRQQSRQQGLSNNVE